MEKFIEENLPNLPEEIQKKFVLTFKFELESYKAYNEKSGIGTYIFLKQLPVEVIQNMKKFIENIRN